MKTRTKPSALTPSLYLLGALVCASAWLAGCRRAPPPRPAHPLVPVPRERAAYVTDNGSDTLSVIDRDGLTVVAVPIDLAPRVHQAPHHLAVDAQAGSLVVALAFPPPPSASKQPHQGHGSAEEPGKLARLDLATLAVQASRDVDANPGDVILTHDRARALVTHFDMKRAMQVAAAGGPTGDMFATLQVRDARDLSLLASRALCVAPHGVVTTRDDRTAIVACYGSDEIAVVDLTSAGLGSARYPLGASPGPPGAPRYGPYSVALSPDESRVAVSNLEGQSVRVFDRGSRRFGPDIPLGARVFMSTWLDERTLLSPLQAPDGMARVDLESGTVTARMAVDPGVCISPHVVRVARDGRAYVVCEGDHTRAGCVLEIDPATLAVKHQWRVGVYPDGIAFGDD